MIHKNPTSNFGYINYGEDYIKLNTYIKKEHFNLGRLNV